MMNSNSGSESRNLTTSLSHKPSSAAHSVRNHSSSSTPHTAISSSTSPKSSAASAGNTARKENGGRSSAGGVVNGHDSEADTDILTDEERPRPRKQRQGPNDNKRASPAIVAKSEPTSHPASRRSSMDIGGGKDGRRINGTLRRDGEKRPTNKVKSVEKATSSSSRAQSAEASLSVASDAPSETAYDSPDRARQSLSVEPRKRKLSDEQGKSKGEPPKQRPRLDSSTLKSKRLSSPGSNPPTSGGHKRSISNQSGIARVTSRKKREVSTTSAQSDRAKWDDDDDSSEDSDSPRPRKDRSIPHLAPSKTRLLSSSRALTSPARINPIHVRRADKYGTTPLAKACEKGQLDQVRKAYEQAPEELDQDDNGGFTPLQKASLGGHFEVVKFLIDKGCRTDCCSKEDRDTPLIDAVENGHYKVVKLLLDSGVNPHHANKNGNRAIDAVNEDADHAEEIENALKKAMDEWQGGEDDHQEAPNEPVVIQPRRDGGLRPDLLYQALTPDNLLKYSTSGDLEAIGMFLESVEPTIACAVAAARSGHVVALELLLASAQTMERDPSPIKYDETPMLAAIGRGHLKVIELLLNQDNFNPCRKTRDGKTYYDLAAERRGPRWQQEVELLKARYDQYKENAGKKREGKGGSSRSANKEHITSSPKSPRLSKSVLKQQQAQQAQQQSSTSRSEKPALAAQPVMDDEQREKKKRLSGGSTKESKDGSRKRRVVEEEDSSDKDSDDHATQHASSKRRSQSSISRQQSLSQRKGSTSTGSSLRHKEREGKEREKEKEESYQPASPRLKSKPGRKPQVKREEVDADNDVTMEDVPPAKSSEDITAVKDKEKERNSKRAAREEAAERRAREEAEAQLKAEAEAREREEREAKLKKEKEEAEKKKREREAYLAKLPIMLRRALEKGCDRPMISYRPESSPSPGQTLNAEGGAVGQLGWPKRVIGVKEAFLPLYMVKHQDIDHSLKDQSKLTDKYILSHQIVGILGLPELDIAAAFPNWQTLFVTQEHLEKYLLGWDVTKLMMEKMWPQMGQRGYDHEGTNSAIETCKSQFVALHPLLRWVRVDDFAKEFERRRNASNGKESEKLKELVGANGDLQKMDLLNLRRPRPAGYRPWDDLEYQSQQSNGVKNATGGIASREVVKKKPEGLRSGLGSVYMPGAKYKDLISPRSASVVTSTKGSPVGSAIASPVIPQGSTIGNARSPSIGVNGVMNGKLGSEAFNHGEDTVMEG